MPASYKIRLAKEDFKFSVAHFTIFGSDCAERLHGHNYRIIVEVAGPTIDELGLLIDLGPLKKSIRSLCATLDGKTLLPESCPLLEVVRDEGRIDVRFEDRSYSFPDEDTLLLPILNTTLEELALYSWKKLAAVLDRSQVFELSVEVAETPGQSCQYSSPL